MTPLQSWKMCRRARGDGKHTPPYGHGLLADTDYAYAINIGGAWYIFIDGSSNIIEWLKNLMWFRSSKRRRDKNGKKMKKTRDAAGFRLTAHEFYNQLVDFIPTDKQILIFGHSRGGAIAQSLSLIMEHRGYNVSFVRSFGSPKVGGKRFCECMAEAGIEHERFAMRGDIVPRLPFLRGKHYETKYILLENNLHGFIKRHLGYGAFLKGLK